MIFNSVMYMHKYKVPNHKVLVTMTVKWIRVSHKTFATRYRHKKCTCKTSYKMVNYLAGILLPGCLGVNYICVMTKMREYF